MFQVLRQDENALSLVFITLILSDKQQKGELTFVINAQRKTVIYNLWSYMTVFDMIRCTHRAVCRFFSMAVLLIIPYRDDTICQDCFCICHVDVRDVRYSCSPQYPAEREAREAVVPNDACSPGLNARSHSPPSADWHCKGRRTLDKAVAYRCGGHAIT